MPSLSLWHRFQWSFLIDLQRIIYKPMKALKFAAVGLAALLATAYTNIPKEKPAADGSVPALSDYAESLPLNTIKLPAGFKIEVFAEVPDARQMAASPSGIVYVGNKDKNSIYALKDTNGDNKAD